MAFRSRQTLAVLRGPLTRKEVGMLGQGAARRRATPPELGLPQRWLLPPGLVALGLTVPVGAPSYRALVYGRYRVRFRGAAEPVVVHRVGWADEGIEGVREVELQDGWLRKVAVEAGNYQEVVMDVEAVREGWMARVREEAVWEIRGLVVRGEVECIGVVVVWVGLEG